MTKEEFSQAGARISKKQVGIGDFQINSRNTGHLTKIEAVYKRNDQDGDGRLSRDEYNALVNRRT